jgi:hypothetical protein
VIVRLVAQRKITLRRKSSEAATSRHINLHGRYEFTKNTNPIDINEILRALAKVPVREIQAA